MARKPRADAKLKSLPPEQKAELTDWLASENVSYAEARERLAKRFGVSTSVGALQDFYSSECFGLRNRHARDVADELKTQLLDSPELFDEATIGAVSQRAFELAVARDADVDELATLVKMIGDSAKLRLKAQELKLSERRVAILEKKAAQAEAAETVTRDQKLTPDQREERYKEIFGIGKA